MIKEWLAWTGFPSRSPCALADHLSVVDSVYGMMGVLFVVRDNYMRSSLTASIVLSFPVNSFQPPLYCLGLVIWVFVREPCLKVEKKDRE